MQLNFTFAFAFESISCCNSFMPMYVVSMPEKEIHTTLKMLRLPAVYCQTVTYIETESDTGWLPDLLIIPCKKMEARFEPLGLLKHVEDSVTRTLGLSLEQNTYIYL